jgi:hypothetical protein
MFEEELTEVRKSLDMFGKKGAEKIVEEVKLAK